MSVQAYGSGMSGMRRHTGRAARAGPEASGGGGGRFIAAGVCLVAVRWRVGGGSGRSGERGRVRGGDWMGARWILFTWHHVSPPGGGWPPTTTQHLPSEHARTSWREPRTRRDGVSARPAEMLPTRGPRDGAIDAFSRKKSRAQPAVTQHGHAELHVGIRANFTGASYAKASKSAASALSPALSIVCSSVRAPHPRPVARRRHASASTVLRITPAG